MDAFSHLVESLVECTRCGRLCALGSQPNPKGLLMIYATEGDTGFCADCAATAFLKGIETIAYGIEKNGTKILLSRQAQEQFGAIMIVGGADAKPEELNWQNIVDNWDRPIPKRRKKRDKGSKIPRQLKLL